MMTDLLKIIYLVWLLIFINACSDEHAPVGRMPPVLSLGEVAPDFDYQGLILTNEDPKKLSSLNGKVVYVDFWASWCKPCLISMPLLNQLHEELKDSGFEVLAVNLDNDPDKGRQFLAEHPVNYAAVRSVNESIAQLYQINGLPTAYLIDRQGVIRNVHQGFKESDIKEIKKQLLLLLK